VPLNRYLPDSTSAAADVEQAARKRAASRYAFACEAREVEICLFWKRSVFFWGFIAAAFVAFAQLRDRPALLVIVSGFGLVCSVICTLANR